MWEMDREGEREKEQRFSCIQLGTWNIYFLPKRSFLIGMQTTKLVLLTQFLDLSSMSVN